MIKLGVHAMGCLGVHFALTEAEVTALRMIVDQTERVTYLREVIEEDYFTDHEAFVAQSDKAWDAMHRALADGELSWDGGDYPLNHTVLAGEMLYDQLSDYGELEYILSLKTPDQVRDIAAVLPGITEEDFRKRYFAINAESYGMDLSEEDFGYTWSWFQTVRDLFLLAAQEGRYVLFTADQ